MLFVKHYYIYCSPQALCTGVMVTSALALSFIDDIDTFGDTEDGDRFRSIALWLLLVGIAGMITHGVLLIIRSLYYREIWNAKFTAFAAVVSFSS